MSGPGIAILTSLEPDTGSTWTATSPGRYRRPLNQTGSCRVIDGSYYLDAAAMQAWLRHPMFHVIK